MNLAPTLHLRLVQSKHSDIDVPILQQWFVMPVAGVVVMDSLCSAPGVFQGEWRNIPIVVE